ncbi:winged helix-turn-helix transcriptional regulator [Ruania rhizosphaerae]|uniref:winged helix-turn-helix transcriptional regulator n=1 Tax=Ruania rhizosphaerae TaxID=1840413 RepID=UPI00190F72CD|nr:helix-turn-helix domain-containing protein [Ruania rhizosphaerae]
MRASVINALEVCPVEVAISAVGGAWKLTIVKHLLAGTFRFGELRRAVGPVSERTLARQLRELETDGLVHREVYAEVPPRVEYSLTELGASLREVVAAMDAWGAVLSREAETAWQVRQA